MKYLVTGGCGFVGSNIVARLIHEGADVTIFDSLARRGASANFDWLQSLGKQQFVHGDIRNAHDVDRLVADLRPYVIFHLGGQVR